MAMYKNPKPVIDIDNSPNKQENDLQDYTKKESVYFAFIDVLGFKKTFDDMKTANDIGKVDKYKDVFNYFFELMNATPLLQLGTGCYAGQTSDSLYFYTDRADFLMSFIRTFMHFNMYAMSKDVFFRGGIAKGSLYKKKDYQFYGDSVINAYLMENSISKNPIITIDEQTRKDLCCFPEYIEIESESSSRHYLKPFGLLKKEINLDISDAFHVRDINSDDINKYIESNCRLFEYDANNYSKYDFLRSQYQEATKESEDR